jgi:transposase-like protein
MTQPTSEISSLPLPSRFDVVSEIRRRVREAIEFVLNQEIEEALGAARYDRSTDRKGYRNGSEGREVTTEYGPTPLSVPRGRLFEGNRGIREWRSEILPRYQRRTRKVDEAIVGCYLAGANTRRIRKALAPLLGSSSLSKSAISRVIGRLKERFEEWRGRDLSGDVYQILFLDAMMLPVRLARRVVKVPVQAVLGVREDGQKVLLSVEIASSESTASWKAVVEDLAGRGLRSPALVILDGNAGLRRAVGEAWPGTPAQRCTKHKLENLLAKAPKHCHAELKRDYQAITHGSSVEAVKQAYDRFVTKWSRLCQEVVKSLQEAGEELLTFTRFPKPMWKSIRTTNSIERVNLEFRRRTKTQGSFRDETSALILLFGLFAMGQIQLRRIDGWKELSKIKEMDLRAAA